jgi:hypothetical protein
VVEWIGWTATAIFAASYLFREPHILRRTQALAAVLWILYGLAINSVPVVVANVVVALIALMSSINRSRSGNARPAAKDPA